jgi:hypothetical protein
MSKCEFCGEEAGFLRKKHRECPQRYDEGGQKIVNLAQNSVFSSNPLDSLEKEINQAMGAVFEETVREAVGQGR